MEEKLRQSWLALVVAMAVAVVILAPDIAVAQSDGSEVIEAGGTWMITLAKKGAVVLLFFGILAAVGTLITGSVAAAAIAFFCILVGGALLWGADTAIASWFSGGGGVGI